MASSSKRQQTMAKRNREQAVREKRELKLAKKHAAALARNAPPEEIELTGPLAPGFVRDTPPAEELVDGNGTPPAEQVLADPPQAEGVIDDTPGS
jgi:hypothetical protein